MLLSNLLDSKILVPFLLASCLLVSNLLASKLPVFLSTMLQPAGL
jgi:hypothetical protein